MAKTGLYCWNVFSWCVNMCVIGIFYPIAIILCVFGAWGLAYNPAFELVSSLKYPEMVDWGLTDIQIVIGLGSAGGFDLTPQ